MEWLNNTANILQIITSLAFFKILWDWGMKKLEDKKRFLPILLITMLLLTVLVSAASLADRAGWLPHRGLVIVNGRHFENESVVVDDHAFYGCTFERVEFHFKGGNFYFNPDTKFIGRSSITVNSVEASRVVDLMLYMGFLKAPPDSEYKILPPSSLVIPSHE
jgi:hypothetical protein